ncbi:MAG: hypothetical protein IPH75_10555 [bacterium]|nr:hypothetical protein [bacterium]
MTRRILIGTCLLLIASLLWIAGCDKERIVNSKEYIYETKYVESPPDTITLIDTVNIGDTMIINRVDTIRITDIDTIIRTVTVHDTVRITSVVHDTVRTVQINWDTVVVHDTITRNQCLPNVITAIAAMEAQTDPLIYEFILGELGLDGGWNLYQTPNEMEVNQVSSTTWDIYSYVDYWAPDWSGYYPLEVYWRMTYRSGDPADPDNWQMSDPPTAVAGHIGGVSKITRKTEVRSLQ